MNPLRHHHYLFAHRLIPTLFFQDTLQFVSLLQRDGLRFLEFWWRRVGEDVPQEERLSADGLGYTIREVAHGWVAVVIMMPLPQGMTEAYFVGLFFRPEGETLIPRVFTLEKTMSYLPTTTETPMTVLCEWTATGAHRNTGKGMAPELETFLAAAALLVN